MGALQEIIEKLIGEFAKLNGGSRRFDRKNADIFAKI